MSNASRVEILKTPITFDKFNVGENQKEGSKSAQFRQTVTTKSYYASKKAHNEFSGGMFSQEDFGYGEQEFVSVETRVAFELVPEKVTENDVNAILDTWNKQGATIYRVLSSHPVLTTGEEAIIEQGLRTKDFFADKQVVRYPDNHEKAGQIALDSNGKVQYRRTGLAQSDVEDEDNRTSDPNDVYLSFNIQGELGQVAQISGQTL